MHGDFWFRDVWDVWLLSCPKRGLALVSLLLHDQLDKPDRLERSKPLDDEDSDLVLQLVRRRRRIAMGGVPETRAPRRWPESLLFLYLVGAATVFGICVGVPEVDGGARWAGLLIGILSFTLLHVSGWGSWAASHVKEWQLERLRERVAGAEQLLGAERRDLLRRCEESLRSIRRGHRDPGAGMDIKLALRRLLGTPESSPLR